tara:strand:+ start:171 stop:437 length:267 start_codon:yes stop_codon:yes gene_type:complete
MPRYIYKCEECDITFQKVHSIKERLTDCEDCNTENTLKRVPSMPLVLVKKQEVENRPVGDLVREYIENAREDLKEEKREMSNQEHDSD